MAKRAVFVTGDKELDAKLRAMPAALERKLIRGALRKSGKRDQQETIRIIKVEAYDTGAFSKSTKIRALKRKRGRVGIQVVVPADVLFAKYAATHGGKQPHPMKGQTRPHYYIATIEFGDEDNEPVRPIRRALYDNQGIYRAYFLADIRQFINEQKVSTKLSKSTGYTGKNFKK